MHYMEFHTSLVQMKILLLIIVSPKFNRFTHQEIHVFITTKVHVLYIIKRLNKLKKVS